MMERNLFVTCLLSLIFAIYALFSDYATAAEPKKPSSEQRHLMASSLGAKQAGMVDGVVSKALKIIYSDEEVVVVPDEAGRGDDTIVVPEEQ